MKSYIFVIIDLYSYIFVFILRHITLRDIINVSINNFKDPVSWIMSDHLDGRFNRGNNLYVVPEFVGKHVSHSYTITSTLLNEQVC